MHEYQGGGCHLSLLVMRSGVMGLCSTKRCDGFMQYKKVYPLGDDVVGACPDNFLKVAHFFDVERMVFAKSNVTAASN